MITHCVKCQKSASSILSHLSSPSACRFYSLQFTETESPVTAHHIPPNNLHNNLEMDHNQSMAESRPEPNFMYTVLKLMLSPLNKSVISFCKSQMGINVRNTARFAWELHNWLLLNTCQLLHAQMTSMTSTSFLFFSPLYQ